MEDLASGSDLPERVLIEAVRNALGRFPTYVRARGAEYFHRRRVDAIERHRDSIQAVVYGTRKYRSAWSRTGDEATPRCSCPAGPWCKHAYALALAVLAEYDRQAGAGRPTWREPSAQAGGWVPTVLEPRDPPDLAAEAEGRVAAELEAWAHRHTSPPSRSLRVVLSVENRAEGAGILLEARVTTPRLKDQERSYQ